MLRVEYALTSDRTMKALTGLTRPEFRALVPALVRRFMTKLYSVIRRASAARVGAVRRR